MQKAQRLFERLHAIAASLKDSGDALALLGLGSAGIETERMDEYSDLDFFAIVKPGFRDRFLDNLDWLTAICPLIYTFRNTVDGYKVLFEDAIFCEFGVFEPHELRTIPFTRGRLIWKDDSFDESLCVPQTKQRDENPVEGTDEWHLGEVLTNLYVGLGRVYRGEILTGTRFIQSYAIDHVLPLTRVVETALPHTEDPFNQERRYEFRYPQTSQYLPTFIQGYERNVESALAILTFLERYFVVSPVMSTAIRELCARQ
jgi:hypothetical protein